MACGWALPIVSGNFKAALALDTGWDQKGKQATNMPAK